MVWNSGRKVLLRAPAPSQENVAYEDDSPRPNLEASTGGRNAVDVGQDEDENASATPPRDASGARVATPVTHEALPHFPFPLFSSFLCFPPSHLY